MEDNITRYPRPLGATRLGYELDKDRSKKNVAQFRAFIIRAYISGNLWWPTKTITHISVEDKEAMKALKATKSKESSTPSANKKRKPKQEKLYKELYVHEVKHIEVNQLALGLGLTEIGLIKRLEKAYEKEGSIMATQQGYINGQAMARVAFSGLFFKSLDKAQSQTEWAEEIKAVTRLRGYSPAMIMATNTAMTQEGQALNLAANLAKTFLASNDQKGTVPNVNIQNNIGTVPATVNGQLLTPTMAQKMLAEAGITTQPLDLEAIALKHGIHGTRLPEIEATPADAQGLNLPTISDLGFDDIGTQDGEVPDKDRHTNRRAESLDIIDGLVH